MVEQVIGHLLAEDAEECVNEDEGRSSGDAGQRLLDKMRSVMADESILRTLEKVLHDLEIWEPIPSLRKCVKWAVDLFHELFHSNIVALLAEHPPDSHDEEGEPFWTGTRKVGMLKTFEGVVGH